MDRINYAGDTFLTGSLIAHALMDYAQALAEVGSAATVEIPTMGGDGVRSVTAILIGPSSQLTSTTITSEFPELEDTSLVESLADLAEKLRREITPTARPAVDNVPPVDYFSEFGI